MKLYHLLFISIVVLFFSCGKGAGNNMSGFLNQDQLLSQIFTVNTTHDTTLLTKNGCIINIPKESLESDSNNVKLEIKEALSNTDIILAGLTTMSSKQALSSGGMIYINAAAGYKVTIKKQLKILVPTKNYNPDMQIFKGEKEGNGKIDWKDPTPLPKDETLNKITEGEKLFKANCSNCHKIYDNFTGPALYGITDSRSKKWLYDFTRNPGGMINTVLVDSTKETDFYHDIYCHCLMQQWSPLRMTAFPALNDEALDALYSYIKTETDKRPDLKEKYGTSCCDSCITFGKAIYHLEMKRQNLEDKMIDKDDEFFSLDRQLPVPPVNNTPETTTTTTSAPLSTKVSPVFVKGTYYSINIQAMGWYNIDILMKDYSNCVPSELFVRLQGSYKIDMNVVLVIPSVKAFVEGGKLDDKQQYGFDETDGKINLPPNAKCYVMAFAENNDKLIFGKTSFNAQQKQTIDIVLAETTKETMQSEIKALNLDAVKMDIKEDSIAVKLKNINKEMGELMKLQPKNCACDFLK